MEKTTAPVSDTQRMRRFVFTINNWTQEEYDALKAFDCQWIVFGREKGSTSHLQGACILGGRQMSRRQLSKTVAFRRAYTDIMRGTPEQSLDYCTKEDHEAYIGGEIPNPGKRNDLLNACNALRDGKSMEQLAEDHGPTIVKYSKGLIYFKSLITPKTRVPPKVFWLYGETGTGKTRSAVEFAETLGSYWLSNGSLRWFDGYNGQSVAILDDFRADGCSFDFLLRLLDRYPFRVEFKGGFVDWIPEYIFITCWGPPEELFNLKGQGDMAQLTRRITKTIEVRRYPMDISLQQLLNISGLACSEVLTDGQDNVGANAIGIPTTEGTRRVIDLTAETSGSTQRREESAFGEPISPLFVPDTQLGEDLFPELGWDNMPFYTQPNEDMEYYKSVFK